MRIRDLSASELRRRASGKGLAWEVGPFAVRLHTGIRAATEGVGFLYRDFPVVDPSGVVDAEIVVERKTLWPAAIRIRVDGETQYDWLRSHLIVPMVEWTMNVCVFQRAHQYFMLHSAVVSRNGQAVIFAGRAGSGKSTLCAALVQRGWRLLSDEVALIQTTDGRIRPVPRPISLKEASIEAIRRYAHDATIGPLWTGTAKGTVAHVLPPSDSVERAGETAAAAWLLFPSYEDGSGAEVAELPKAQAFIRAADNAFNYGVHGRQGFELLSDLIDRCSCYAFRYDDLERAVARLERLTASG